MQGKRLDWVDAMRGFSMIIVVLGHVLLEMGIGGYNSLLSSMLLTFRMPLFFFVSGFFSYKAIEFWTPSRIQSILNRKIKAQIIGTIIFCSIFQISRLGGVSFHNGFEGYWFTIVLFQMYIFYLALSVISKWTKSHIVIPGLIVLSILGIVILTRFRYETWLWNFLCWENLTKYLQYFTLGIICAKYKNQFFSFLSSNIVITCAIIGWTICMILWYNPTFKAQNSLLYSFVHDIAVRYFGLITIVILFFKRATALSSNIYSVKLLRFIGRRTLDIYFIHYLLLPNLKCFYPYVNDNHQFVIQLLISGFITAVIILLCLLISTIIRESNLLSNWLFGVKTKTIINEK